MEKTVKIDEDIEDFIDEPGELDYNSPNKLLIFVDKYNKFTYDNQYGNCKVCTLQNLQTAYLNNPTITKARLNELFNSVSKFMFFVTFTMLDVVNKFKEIYKVVYIIRVPIGYHGDYQYHCGFMVNTEYYGEDEEYELSFQERVEEEGVKLIS